MTTLDESKLRRILISEGCSVPFAYTKAETYLDLFQAVWRAAQAEQRAQDAALCMTTGIKTAAQSGQEACAVAIRGQE